MPQAVELAKRDFDEAGGGVASCGVDTESCPAETTRLQRNHGASSPRLIGYKGIFTLFLDCVKHLIYLSTGGIGEIGMDNQHASLRILCPHLLNGLGHCFIEPAAGGLHQCFYLTSVFPEVQILREISVRDDQDLADGVAVRQFSQQAGADFAHEILHDFIGQPYP